MSDRTTSSRLHLSDDWQVIFFLTNNFALAARTIADIYKARGQIELLFKEINQNLKIKTFVSTSKPPP